ncbi:MAG: peptidylprolyl isomerase [Proteobacteria bacterium]|nr:peptidylprolyl isomerase [Pseudomonadota bacterium]
MKHALSALALTWALAASAATPPRASDYIVAVVNNDAVTEVEVQQALANAREQARQQSGAMPNEADLRRQTIDRLVNERVIVTYARDMGVRVDEPELDRAVANVVTANRLASVDALRERLRADGLDFKRFRDNLRDQILAERVREREVPARIKVSDADVDAMLAERGAARVASQELNLAQILITVPDGAGEAEVAERRALAQGAITRVRGGEDFGAVARELSQDTGTRAQGGEMGQKAADRYPDLFTAAARGVAVGDVAAEPLRSGAGFHVIKVLARKENAGMTVTQTHPRHILLRPSAELSAETARQRLGDLRTQIDNGRISFEDAARRYSEDGSAQGGGDLGWVSPGQFVPEFEQAMGKLDIGAISQPVVSRFGVHLIQVLERRQAQVDLRQLRDQARNVLRERQYDKAYAEWLEELRGRAWIELREKPER